MGTAFDCATNEITLLHSAYKSERGAFGMCNNRAIMARSLGAEDSYYISQVNVTLNSDFAGKTIMCVNILNLTSQMVQFSMTIPDIITGISYKN